MAQRGAPFAVPQQTQAGVCLGLGHGLQWRQQRQRCVGLAQAAGGRGHVADGAQLPCGVPELSGQRQRPVAHIERSSRFTALGQQAAQLTERLQALVVGAGCVGQGAALLQRLVTEVSTVE